VGLLNQQMWTRPEQAKGKGSRPQAAIEEKESARWLRSVHTSARLLPEEVRKIVIADREADIYELLSVLMHKRHDFVLRGTHNRVIEGEAGRLSTALENAPVNGCTTMRVRAADGRGARTARLLVRAVRVTLEPGTWVRQGVRERWQAEHPEQEPLARYPLEPLSLGVVEVIEHAVPEGEQGLHWRLLTSLPVDSLEDGYMVMDTIGCDGSLSDSTTSSRADAGWSACNWNSTSGSSRRRSRTALWRGIGSKRTLRDTSNASVSPHHRHCMG